ncbi:MAG: hypothetical protein ACE5IT_07180 [bacterium]
MPTGNRWGEIKNLDGVTVTLNAFFWDDWNVFNTEGTDERYFRQ